MATSTAYAFFDALVRCETRIYNCLDGLMRERHGIAMSQFEFLRYVSEHRKVRVADLATNFAVGVGATSKGLDRLERRGLLERVPNPDDRRSSLVVLTPAGNSLLADAKGAVEDELVRLTEALSPDLIREVGQALSDLRTELEATAAGVPAG